MTVINAKPSDIIHAAEGATILDSRGKQILPEIQVVQAMGVSLAAISVRNLRIMTLAERQLVEFLSKLPEGQEPCFITDGKGNVHDEAFGFWENGRAVLTPGVMPKRTPWLDTVTRRNAHMDQCGFQRLGREYDWPSERRGSCLDKLQYRGAFKELFAKDKFEDGHRSLWGNEPGLYNHALVRNLSHLIWLPDFSIDCYSAVPLRSVAVTP